MRHSMFHSEKGYAITVMTFFIMLLMLSLATTVSSLAAWRQNMATNALASTQAYYAAESGIEDALLQINASPQMASSTYSLAVGPATTSVTIPTAIGGSRSIVADGAKGSSQRRVRANYGIDSENVSFYYGVAVGAGGLQMGSGSVINGNVFSSGNISGSGTINNDVVISGNGNSLQGVYVGGNAFTYSCLSPASVDDLTYVTGGSHTCTVRGSTTVQSSSIAAQPMPISQEQITGWKDDAAAGTVISGNLTLSNGASQTVGPAKITGNLVLSNNAILTLSGTVYVVGTITISNGARIKLSSSYDTVGGIIMADGTINISNGATFSGSGQAGSYVLLMSNSTSNTAISVSNNAQGAVLYTSAGGLSVSNGVSLVEATGYKVIMSNNSQIQYSSGLVNIYFSNGPGGGNKVTSWGEE